METAIRQQKDTATLAAAAGDATLQRQCQGSVNALVKEYERLSDRTGLGPDFRRTYVAGFGDAKAKNLTARIDDGNMKLSSAYGKEGASERHHEPLSLKERNDAENAMRRQGYQGQIFYSERSDTSFHGSIDGERYYYIVIGMDAYPKDGDVGTANELISLDGCAAHEVIGHYEAWIKGTSQADDLLEEVQASIRASRFGIGLTDRERHLLFQDAMDRLQNAGVRYEDVKDTLDIKER